jgi:DNA replication protein DnaD
MKMQMLASSKDEKSDIEKIRGLNLAAVKRISVDVTRQQLQYELHDLWHDLQRKA